MLVFFLVSFSCIISSCKFNVCDVLEMFSLLVDNWGHGQAEVPKMLLLPLILDIH